MVAFSEVKFHTPFIKLKSTYVYTSHLVFHLSHCFAPIIIANSGGYFSSELTPVEVKGKKGKTEVFEVDEHPRETTLEKLASLPPVFKENGTVTAGNASVSQGLLIWCPTLCVFCYIGNL